MKFVDKKHVEYFKHLEKISILGKIYKKYFISPILFLCAKRFGTRMLEVGSGLGSGILGKYPKNVIGVDINPLLVEHCNSNGLTTKLIGEDGGFPFKQAEFDACIIDNVLEHLDNPRQTLDECFRVTVPNGGLVIVVPGIYGFATDPDHKVYYDNKKLIEIDQRWESVGVFSLPFFFLCNALSKRTKHYYLVSVHKKK